MAHKLDYTKTLDCTQCGTTHKVKYNRWARRNHSKFYCSQQCEYKAKGFQKSKTITCEQCGKIRKKPYTDYIKSDKHFCSQSCSATYYNIQSPKRKPEGKCKICQTQISKSLTYCSKCYKDKYLIDMNMTLKDLEIKCIKYPQAKWNRIRELARKWAVENNYTSCEYCGYSFYTEVCHINPLKSFDDSATLAEVNNSSNLVILCPNHHKELDKKKISIDDIKLQSYRSI